MTKIIALNAALGIEDSTAACHSFSGKTNRIVLTLDSTAPKTTSFGHVARERSASGIANWNLVFDTYFGAGVAEADTILADIQGASTAFRFGPSGSVPLTDYYYGASGILSEYSIEFEVRDAGRVTGTIIPRSGSISRLLYPVWGSYNLLAEDNALLLTEDSSELLTN